ncbi:MAG: isoprenyl transferase [Candidatus Omnitrophica bacterium]|nr:isoprenyl transferase [Candidatus Omnitrophota bacterium]
MIEHKAVPQHVAIIMDGNGRWAKERNLPRTAGHREGIKRVEEIISAAAALGVKVVTFFAFSTENWTRPKREIDMLMRSLSSFLDIKVKELHKNNIKLVTIGRDEPLPEFIIKKLRAAEETTRYNTALTVVLALNYGARQEIVDAAIRFAKAVLKKEVSPDDLDPERFNQLLYTQGLPDPDLLIRTSGELRISNFLLWQASYAELVFLKKYWPDFRKKDFEEAIAEYQRRDRRFGAVSPVPRVKARGLAE